MVPDSALDWWARGFATGEIRRIIHERTGRLFTHHGIYGAILWARKRGDPRASRRKP